ncbi:hypothetical protein DFAR_2970009 [Desulfarculales bacterium]
MLFLTTARRLTGLPLILSVFSLGLAATPPVKNVIMFISDGCSVEQ